jgi:hypothetical protein
VPRNEKRTPRGRHKKKIGDPRGGWVRVRKRTRADECAAFMLWQGAASCLRLELAAPLRIAPGWLAEPRDPRRRISLRFSLSGISPRDSASFHESFRFRSERSPLHKTNSHD